MIQTAPNSSLRERRAALRLSERQLAELAHVSRTSVRKAEAGMELRPVVRTAIEQALTRAEAGDNEPVAGNHGLYYVTRTGDVVDLTDDESAAPAGPEGAVLRALLGYASDRMGAAA
jgi:DNA-binding XRE family transcriptional regulator